MNLNKISYGDINLYPTTLKIQNGAFITLTSTSLDEVSTTTNIESYPLTHGALVGDTYLNQRTAKLEGKIIANSKEQLEEIENILRVTFSPAEISKKKLKFQDKDGKSWQTDMQPSKTIVFQKEETDEYTKKFTATLVSASPYIFSVDSFTKKDINRTQGATLPISFPLNFKYENVSDIICGGTISTPLCISITAKENISEEDIIFKNFNTKENLTIANTPLEKGDIMIINSDKKIITLNDEEITNNITTDSVWPRLITGQNQIILDVNRETDILDITYTWQERMI